MEVKKSRHLDSYLDRGGLPGKSRQVAPELPHSIVDFRSTHPQPLDLYPTIFVDRHMVLAPMASNCMGFTSQLSLLQKQRFISTERKVLNKGQNPIR